jgi:hypothetical protein
MTHGKRPFTSKRRNTEKCNKCPVDSQLQLSPCSANVFYNMQLNNLVIPFELVFVRMQCVQKILIPIPRIELTYLVSDKL